MKNQIKGLTDEQVEFLRDKCFMALTDTAASFSVPRILAERFRGTKEMKFIRGHKLYQFTLYKDPKGRYEWGKDSLRAPGGRITITIPRTSITSRPEDEIDRVNFSRCWVPQCNFYPDRVEIQLNPLDLTKASISPLYNLDATDQIPGQIQPTAAELATGAVLARKKPQTYNFEVKIRSATGQQSWISELIQEPDALFYADIAKRAAQMFPDCRIVSMGYSPEA